MNRSSKHGPMVDDVMSGEVEGAMRAGHETRAEEYREKEPSGDSQPDVDLVPDGTFVGGTPPGMSERDVAMRSDVARYLHRSSFPAVREILLNDAIDEHAPDEIVDLLRRLPSGREYENVNDVMTALGAGVEQQRF